MFLTETADLSPDKLIDVGLGPTEIQPLARAKTEDDFLEAVAELDEADRNALVNYANREGSSDVAERLQERFGSEGTTALGLYDELIELTAAQQEIVDYDGDRPLVVRGVPGSGKTTIAVQRLRVAADASESLDGNFLLLTFNRTLAGISEQLLQHASGGTLPDNTNVMTVHAWLKHLAELNGDAIDFVRRNTRKELIANAIEKKIQDFQTADFTSEEELQQLRNHSPYYWRREFETYLGTCAGDIFRYVEHDRPARSSEWTMNQARVVARAGSQYVEWLNVRRKTDYSTLAMETRERVFDSDGTIPNYDDIIVDELQDLTWASIEFIRDIAEEAGSRLTLLGDADQSLYRSEFSWEQLDETIGESEVVDLEVNHRTPEPIGRQAERLLTELGRQPGAGYERSSAGEVQIVECRHKDRIPDALVDRVRKLDEAGTQRNRIAALAAQKNTAKNAKSALEAHDIAADYYKDDNRTGLDFGDRSVKVSTIKSAKGLEFDHVIIMRVESMHFPGTKSQAHNVGVAWDHRKAQRRRLLHVAMTRAKKSVTLICNGEYVSHFCDDFDDRSLTHVDPSDDTTDPTQAEAAIDFYAEGAKSASSFGQKDAPQRMKELSQQVDRPLTKEERGEFTNGYYDEMSGHATDE